MANKTPDAAASTADGWRDLTWDDLEQWTGARSLERGRSYQRSGHVRNLARSAEGVLLAWVQGTDRYATRAELKSDSHGTILPSSQCTCPLGIDGCKHGVAVVLAYLDALQHNRAVPIADASDPRWGWLSDAAEEGTEEEDFDEDFEDEEEWTPVRRRRGGAANVSRSAGRGKSKSGPQLREYLEGLPAAELATYLVQLSERHPDVARELKDRAALAGGEFAELIRQARKDIRHLTAQEVWYNSWTGEGNLPEYGGLKQRFEQLRQHGQADALLELGEALFEAGLEQIGSSNDEGETATALGECLDVVLRAVPDSSLPDVRKLMYVIDMALRDEYDILHEMDAVLDRPWSKEAWSEAAEELSGRVRGLSKPKERDFTSRYQREGLVDWRIHCLERAGRAAEILPLCEAEAPLTGSYDRLVARLLEEGRIEDAKRWAQEGIARTEKQWPGIARQLREQMHQLAEREGDWPAVAAFRAEAFFQYPDLETLDELQKAADKAGCGPRVRAAALGFLETGVRPTMTPMPSTKAPARQRGSRKTSAAWPLPVAAHSILAAKKSDSDHPHFDVLLELALQEKQPNEVLRWYDRLTAGKKARSTDWYGDDYDNPFAGRVADAVAATHPERAQKLYQKLIEDYIARTSPSAYEAARPYLRKLRDLLHRAGRQTEWTHYLTNLRDSNRRKRRLLEVLDRLDNRRIVDG